MRLLLFRVSLCLLVGLGACQAAAKFADLTGARAAVADLQTSIDARLDSQATTSLHDLGEIIDSKIRMVTNDLGPIVVLLLGLAAILGAVALVAVWMMIKRHSYLNQKPLWEKRKRRLDSRRPRR